MRVAVGKIVEIVFGHEETRSPRRIINVLGKLASAAYQETKKKNKC